MLRLGPKRLRSMTVLKRALSLLVKANAAKEISARPRVYEFRATVATECGGEREPAELSAGCR